jgi:site-specific recombinase XerC
MDALAFDLKNLTLRVGEGSYLTRNQRHRGLQLVARELADMGYRLPSAHSLKPKHIQALVSGWKAAGLTSGTLKNRMSWVRWWASQVRKTSVLPRDNAELGIEKRNGFESSKAHTTPADKLAALPSWMQLAIRLQMGLGLRLEESLKFRPATADQGNHVALQASWCKGGRARAIPLTHDRQRDLLDAVHEACGDGSLIPQGMSYIAARKAIERATWGASIRNMHGHRH